MPCVWTWARWLFCFHFLFLSKNGIRVDDMWIRNTSWVSSPSSWHRASKTLGTSYINSPEKQSQWVIIYINICFVFSWVTQYLEVSLACNWFNNYLLHEWKILLFSLLAWFLEAGLAALYVSILSYWTCAFYIVSYIVSVRSSLMIGWMSVYCHFPGIPQWLAHWGGS